MRSAADIYQEISGFCFLPPLLMFLIVLFLFAAIRNVNKNRNIRFFIFYGSCSLLQIIITHIFLLSELVEETGITVFISLEFYTFYLLFYNSAGEKYISRKIKLTGILYGSLSVVFLFIYIAFFSDKISLRTVNSYYSAATGFFTIAPVFYYFYYLFTNAPTKNLTREFTFWVSIGIIILQGINIPVFLVEKYLYKINREEWKLFYSITYLGYIILFTCLITGVIRSKKSVTTNYPIFDTITL